MRRHCEVDEKAAHHDCRIERRGSLRRHKLVRRDHSMIKFGTAQCVCEVTHGFLSTHEQQDLFSSDAAAPSFVQNFEF